MLPREWRGTILRGVDADNLTTTEAKMAARLESVAQFARRAGLPRSTAYAAVQAGTVPSVRVAGAIRIPVSWLDRQVERAIADAEAKGQQS